MFYVILLPMIIYNKGIFLYYGDFNSQQLPFYQLAHDSIRSGDFLWNWLTDLGANFIGSYSFYLLGSPFFWLTIPFPSEAVVYLVPILLALKYGVATLTAFAFIKRFVKKPEFALIGALLYAFSGFQSYNVFFNHFHDVTAFFPLLLIAMEERVQNNRRGIFALTVALMAFISYFFFTGEVIFCIIYFIFRCFSKDFGITPRKFLGLAIEAVIGVLISAILLLPSILAIIGNPRTSERILGFDMIVYNDKFRILRIIQSFLMIPDPPANPNLFNSDSAKWSSIAGFLPMFSISGVIAFFSAKKKHWAVRLLIVCGIMACVPILNSLFAGFTSSYYARWFFMPILIMAMMTAVSLDNSEISMKKGTLISITAVLVLALIGCLPKMVGDEIKYFQLPENALYFWICIAVTLLTLLGLYILIYNKRGQKNFPNIALLMTVIACIGCTTTTIAYGVSRGPYPEKFISAAINGSNSINLPDDYFYRIETSENYDNYSMFWKFPNIRAFQSVVPASIMEFYPLVGEERNVASRPSLNKFALRPLFSVKYYFQGKNPENGDISKNLPGFQYFETQNEFKIYQNNNFIPMGFTFEKFISKSSFEKQNIQYRDRILLKALVLDDIQVERYKNLMDEIQYSELANLSIDQYEDDCAKLASNSGYYFQEDGHGFTSKIVLGKNNLVFFSVPFDEGFSATVDGKPAVIERVDGGFMAVYATKGEHEIRFNYTPKGLKHGIIITFFGIIILIGYVCIMKKVSTSHKSKKEAD